MNNLQNLLTHISIISKKYADIARITGENFNIFSVMGIESNEKYTHSVIIGELLNPKGSHCQRSVFLKLFFKEIDELNKIETFDFENATIIIEEYIGAIDEEYAKGGYIDIVIKDNKNVIVIENKIYASDQPNQLMRYKNHYKDCLLFYLNLLGSEPSPESRRNLKNNEDFYIISYQNEIKNWLEKCQKEAFEQPILRETIKQYLNLVKKLTNQTLNNKMSEEIINIMRKDIQSSFEIAGNIWKLKEKLYGEFIERIEAYANSKNIGSHIKHENNDYGIYLNSNQLKFFITFEKANYNELYLGIYLSEFDDDKKKQIKEKFTNFKPDSSNQYIWKYPKYKDWGDNLEIWELVANGEMLNEIKQEIEKIIEAINS